jgi:HAD superfamily hydrolase (TIGR01548 family)
MLPQVDAVLLDVDGVIVNVAETFRVVVCETAQFYGEQFLGFERDGRLIDPPEVELFKRAGGFNNDWDLTLAVLLLAIAKSLRYETKNPQRLRELSPTLEEFTDEIARRGGGLSGAETYVLEYLDSPTQRRELSLQWNQRDIVQIFQEIYAGTKYCKRLYGFDPEHVQSEGYVDKERVLLNPRAIPPGIKLGVLTGRTLEETRLVLQRAHLTDIIPEAHWVTHDDGVQKPEGRTLALLAERLRFRTAIYVGDTLDDWRTVRNYRELRGAGRSKVIGCLVLSGAAGAQNHALFLEQGAEIVAPDVNAVMTFLGAMLK